jgi:hypothetical protein
MSVSRAICKINVLQSPRIWRTIIKTDEVQTQDLVERQNASLGMLITDK